MSEERVLALAEEAGERHEQAKEKYRGFRKRMREEELEHYGEHHEIGMTLWAIHKVKDKWQDFCDEQKERLRMTRSQADRYIRLAKQRDVILAHIDANPEGELHYNLEKWSSKQFFEMTESDETSETRVVVPRKPKNMTDIKAAFRACGLICCEVDRMEAHGSDDIRFPNLALWGKDAGENVVCRSVFVKDPGAGTQRHRDIDEDEQRFLDVTGAVVPTITGIGQVEAIAKALFETA